LVRPLCLRLAVACCALGTACGCDADLRIRFDASERTLSVGESFTPGVRLLACGGTEPLRDVVTWAAQDTTIARVEPASGRTTALRAGSTLVLATGQRYHQLGGVRVTVVAR
jgi:hypothetical protein